MTSPNFSSVVVADLLERSFDELTHAELVELLGELETVTWQLSTTDYP